MTNRYISTLSTIRKDALDTAGGKGANLGELAGKGFPVPAGFVVSAKAYNVFFASLRLQKILHTLKKAKSDELSRTCGVIRNTITNASFPGELAESILAAHHQLIANKTDETACVVRSSATTEDLTEASFAGQHATYYYVERANLLRMVQYCWASLWSKESVSYRNACGIEHSTAMAVVVQEMIRSDISGITFTANPVSGDNQIVIEASWGMGAAIVDGRVTPDRYILDHDTLHLLDQRIAEKNVMVPNKLPTETSSRLKEVPPGLQQQQTLTPELIETVATWALKAEEHFGSPQNMEWAISEGNFHILQSRPISPVGRQATRPAPKGKYVLFNSSLNGFPDPFTPLTADLISLAASPILRSIHGYSYLNLKYIRPLFPFTFSDSELVNLLARPTSEQVLPSHKFSLLKLPFSLFFWCCAYFIFGVFWARSRNMSERFAKQYKKLCLTADQKTKQNRSEWLIRTGLFPNFSDPIGYIPLWISISSVRPLIPFALLNILTERWIPEQRPEVLSWFCIGNYQLYPASISAELDQLVFKAGQFPSVRDQFLTRPSDHVLTSLKKDPNARPFLQLFDKFIKKNGYRAARELELQSVRWEENSNHVIKLIRDRLIHSANKKTSNTPLLKGRTRLTQNIKQKLSQYPLERPFRLRWQLILLLHKTTNHFLKLSETSRSYHLMAMSIVRRKLLRLEKEFLTKGALRCKGDIFFLHLKEIEYIQRGILNWPDVEERIHQRRHDLIRETRKNPVQAFGVDQENNEQGQPAPSLDSPTAVLPGQTASPGSYSGRARIIMNPQEGSALLPGEILVAPYTDPSWTPLFLIAGGAVIEMGSYLSHAGTSAREYSLPCIVDVTRCTERIQTGDFLWINGEKGEVQILETKQPFTKNETKKNSD